MLVPQVDNCVTLEEMDKSVCAFFFFGTWSQQWQIKEEKHMHNIQQDIS